MSIGLCGPAECGKNTSADLLTVLYGLKQVSFAEPLRQEVASVTRHGYDIPLDIQFAYHLQDLHQLVIEAREKSLDPWTKPTHPVMRKVLQLWGSEFRRFQDADYWAKRAPRGEDLVYTDTRFANERVIPDELWYIWNPAAESRRGEHISENQISLSDCHRVVDNSGSLEHLKSQIVRAYRSYFVGRAEAA
jgi:hypothetical protein